MSTKRSSSGKISDRFVLSFLYQEAGKLLPVYQLPGKNVNKLVTIRVEAFWSHTSVVEFRCNLANLIERAHINQTICVMGTGISKTTISKLVASKSIRRIDRDSTGRLMEYFQCSFKDLWTIKAVVHSDGFNENTG